MLFSIISSILDTHVALVDLIEFLTFIYYGHKLHLGNKEG